MRRGFTATVVLAALPLVALAHEARPAYLELREAAPGNFRVLWKTPMQGDLRLALVAEFSQGVQATSPVLTRRVPGAAVQTWSVRSTSLRGQTVRVGGLEGTMTDALVRVEFADGTSWTERLTPGRSEATVPARPSSLAVAGLYLRLGVEHILTGVDHLLFVLALLILTRGGGRLLATITAFTVAHSITLAAATLGWVHVPQPPVEAVIALSIAFVAAEIVRGRAGHAGAAERWPWLVAFVFGLLHGLGFASGLAEIGLPEKRIPLALLFFNVGVELGQLVFVAAVVLALRAMARARLRLPRSSGLLVPYFIGSVAMFLLIQRVAGFSGR
ncbi:MAG TPA: HupE/UreJ family protein [Myxococcaceae bacterium]|nr:HupE/UreJ family protein [Myxococcaceae bacterium]